MADDDMTYAEYRNEVEALAEHAQDLHDEIDEYDQYEAVWQVVDGHQWIIYYSYNLDVLQLADSEPEEWKHLIDDDAGWRDVLQAMAYRALEADVRDQLRD